MWGLKMSSNVFFGRLREEVKKDINSFYDSIRVKCQTDEGLNFMLERYNKKYNKHIKHRCFYDFTRWRMIKLNINDLVVLEGRVYKVEWSKFSNGKMQGNRAVFKLLNEKELNKMLIKVMLNNDSKK